MRVIYVTVGESICRNQLIAAIQAIVNENPKTRAMNGLYLRACNIV